MSTIGGSPLSAPPTVAVRVPRIALILEARPGLARDAFVKAFREYCDTVLKGAHMHDGLKGAVRMGLPSVDDPFAGTPWDTGRDKIDATIEITLDAANARIEDLVPMVARAGGLLGDVIVAERSTLVAGMAHIRTPANAPLIKPGSPSFLAPFAGHRDPNVDEATFAEWWDDHHAPLALRAFDGYATSYEQLHVNDAATQAGKESAGLGGTLYTIFESNRFAEIGLLKAFFGQVDLMQQAYEDEVGFIAHDRQAAFGWVEQA